MTLLHYIGDFIRGLLLQVPLVAARALFLLVLIALLVWVLFMPRQHVTPPSGSTRLSENLKVWAALSLLVQIVIYSLL